MAGVAEWRVAAETAAANYSVGAWLFLRAIGVIYAIAFLSLARQIVALAGREGISPAREFLAKVREQSGRSRFLTVPTLCRLNADDRFLSFLCWGGALAAMLASIGIATLPALIVCFAFYLSLFNVTRLFLGYQWDVLLLEAGFLGCLMSPLELVPAASANAPPWPVLLLVYWLLFRLVFVSGLAKLRSGDTAWRHLTALRYHYETQPLPTPLAWWAHQLPLWSHKLSAFVMFGIELGAPLLIFAPPPYRHVAGLLFIALMLLIMLTGNYCFFNLLTIALCFVLFDNSFYRQIAPWLDSPATRPQLPDAVLIPAALILFGLSVCRLLRLFAVKTPVVSRVNGWLDAVPVANHYGLFSVMTTDRLEIVVEGSRDGRTWQAYEFHFKPGDTKRSPVWVAPHQPRLDWQMWFAALSDYRLNGWFIAFLIRLLQGSRPVLALLRHNPFPDGPPLYVRAVLYQYRFTGRKTRGATGAWWKREKRWLYCPVYSLRGPERDLMPANDV